MCTTNNMELVIIDYWNRKKISTMITGINYQLWHEYFWSLWNFLALWLNQNKFTFAVAISAALMNSRAWHSFSNFAIKPNYHVSFLLPLLCRNLAWSKLIQLVSKFPYHTDQLTVDSSTNKTCHWCNQTLKPHNLIETIFYVPIP